MNAADPDRGDENEREARKEREARELDRKLGKAVKVRRAMREWSQEDLAAATGIGKRTLVRLEAGDTMKITQVDRIAQAFGLDLVGFLTFAQSLED